MAISNTSLIFVVLETASKTAKRNPLNPLNDAIHFCEVKFNSMLCEILENPFDYEEQKALGFVLVLVNGNIILWFCKNKFISHPFYLVARPLFETSYRVK